MHKDKGTEDWEIFAWAVRDVMSKFGNMKLSTQLNSEKIMYKDFMVGKTDTLTYEGKVFTEKPIRLKKSKNFNSFSIIYYFSSNSLNVFYIY